MDLEKTRKELAALIGREPTEEEFVNYLNHPGDAVKLIRMLGRFGRPNRLPDDIWFEGLELNAERQFHTSDGKIHLIKPIYISRDVDMRGRRTVRYELDNEIFERLVQVEGSKAGAAEVEMADPENRFQIAAPFDADLWIVHKQVGDRVTEGEELFNLSLMKMDTAVTAPVSGVVRRVLVAADYKLDRKMVSVKRGQLLMELAKALRPCADCGAELQEDYAFCPRCGHQVS